MLLLGCHCFTKFSKKILFLNILFLCYYSGALFFCYFPGIFSSHRGKNITKLDEIFLKSPQSHVKCNLNMKLTGALLFLYVKIDCFIWYTNQSISDNKNTWQYKLYYTVDTVDAHQMLIELNTFRFTLSCSDRQGSDTRLHTRKYSQGFIR